MTQTVQTDRSSVLVKTKAQLRFQDFPAVCSRSFLHQGGLVSHRLPYAHLFAGWTQTASCLLAML